jgi:hypothetical protein
MPPPHERIHAPERDRFRLPQRSTDRHLNPAVTQPSIPVTV